MLAYRQHNLPLILEFPQSVQVIIFCMHFDVHGATCSRILQLVRTPYAESWLAALQDEMVRLRREIIHILAVSACSYSKITKQLPADLSKSVKSIDQV